MTRDMLTDVRSQYYDTENITESTLSFRNAVNEPRYREQGDDFCMQYLYGICKYVLAHPLTAHPHPCPVP